MPLPTSPSAPRCFIVPPFLVARLADSEPSSTGGSHFSRALVVDDAIRRGRAAGQHRGAVPPAEPGGPAWEVHDAGHGSHLPGQLVRRDDGHAGGDVSAEEAARGVDAALALYLEVYGRDSWDGDGALTLVSVHYERNYANAFWNGTQLVFGDGDGRIFRRFTHPVDVLGHELTHAVTERTAGLRYQGQSGALNESMSDVFGSCLKQRVHGRDAQEGDWLIGEGIFKPDVQGRALRDMAHPGTAYDDPRLGKDPQPAHMDGYVHGSSDNGGVHINSGIPNRAFYLAAVAIGGTAAEGAGQVWYDALTGDQVGPDTDFAGFAAATVAAAGPHADAVAHAWEQVGVTPGTAGGSTGGGGASGGRGPGRRVQVRRSGGVAGMAVTASVDLDEDPAGPDVAGLLAGLDLHAVHTDEPGQPDAFVYEVEVEGTSARVPEQQLTPALRALVDRVLAEGGAG